MFWILGKEKTHYKILVFKVFSTGRKMSQPGLANACTRVNDLKSLYLKQIYCQLKVDVLTMNKVQFKVVLGVGVWWAATLPPKALIR